MVLSFCRYFQCGFSRTTWKLLLRKMGPSEHDKYSNYILQKYPQDCSFVEIVENLQRLFNGHTILGLQYSTSPCSTQKKSPSAGLNSAGRHFPRKWPFKTLWCHECNQQGQKEGFSTLPVLKKTNKRPHSKYRLEITTHTNSLETTFLPNSKWNRKYLFVCN